VRARRRPTLRRLAAALLVLACALAVVGRGRAAPDDRAPEPTPLPKAAVVPGVSEAPATTPAPDPATYENKIVVKLDAVVESDLFGDSRPPALRCLKEGETATGPVLRACVSEALASGVFADARVEITPDPGGIRVVVRLVPRRLVAATRVDLHDAPFDAEEVLREADLGDGAEIVPTDLPRQRARIEAYFVRRGYPSPVVTITTRPTDAKERVLVLVEVAPGVPRKLARRVFYAVGGRKTDLEPYTDGYTVKVGDRVDEGALGAADVAFEGVLRKAGYHRAEVSHDVVLSQGFVTLRVRVDVGARYRPRFDGNEHYDADALTGALGLDEEADRSGANQVEKLVTFYKKRGYLDVEVTLEERGKATDPEVYQVFHVREGQRVKVAARAYPCLKLEEIRRLKNGGPRSPSEVGDQIDSFLQEELPSADLLSLPFAAGSLDPDSVYLPETYERAASHLADLYRAEGYLSVKVGPVYALRRRCDPKAPPGECRPLPLPPNKLDVCAYDTTGLPVAVPAQDPSETCTPDSAKGIRCEPRVTLSIPIKLGPRSMLYDATFAGAKALAPKALAVAAALDLGGPVSTARLDEARRRVLDLYREEGYAFADVRYSIELSPDRTRARVRFDINELERVYVRRIEVHGNTKTNLDVIMRRVALEVGQPYRASDVRKTQERVATLGTFASVTVALEDPYIPQRDKTVIITVVERLPQSLEIREGFSSDEGVRTALEYSHVNISGRAIGFSLRLQLSYLPEPLIFDSGFRENYGTLSIREQLRARVTAGLTFPQIGLGPLVRAGVDGVIAQDVQRDFTTTRVAGIPNLTYRPTKEVQVAFFPAVEYNDLGLFRGAQLNDYLSAQVIQGRVNTELVRLLNVPQGQSIAYSQKLVFTWDRRDNPFNASTGTLVILSVEHVDAFPLKASETLFEASRESHFFRLTQTLGGYIPLPRGIRFASLLRLGENVQLTDNSQTYPDRLFFMGGVDSMRGWYNATFLPQDVDDAVTATRNLPDRVISGSTAACPADEPLDSKRCVVNADKVTPDRRPVRGGNLMINPRAELRIPIRAVGNVIPKSLDIVETVIFTDIGNLWVDPKYPLTHGFPIRASVGTGVRVQTPVGPLAVDAGLNLTRKSYEDVGAFHFAIGLF